MTTDTNLAALMFSTGGAVFFAIVFVFCLFGAELLTWLLVRGAKKARLRYKLLADKADEGQCPL